MGLTIMKKDQFEVLNYLKLFAMVDYLEAHNIKMLATMKGWLLVDETESITIEVKRVISSKKLLSGKETMGIISEQLIAFNVAWEGLKVAMKWEGSDDTKKPAPGGDEYVFPPWGDKVKIEDPEGDKSGPYSKVKKAIKPTVHSIPMDKPLKSDGNGEPVAGGPLLKHNLMESVKSSSKDSNIQSIPKDGGVSLEHNMSMEPVTLLSATKLFQPVDSTGSSSKYYCVALGIGLKLAARLKDPQSVSIRVEGDIPLYSGTLSGLGVDIKSNTYASLHVAVSTYLEGAKVIGSVIFGMGGAFNHTTHDLKKLFGKGV